MQTLGGAQVLSIRPSRVEIGLCRGYRLILFFLDSYLVRALIVPPQGLRCQRTWSLSPELAGDDPIDGRDRLDPAGFPGCEIVSVAETEAAIAIETALVRVEVRRSPLALTWFLRPSAEAAFEPVLQDRQTQAYCYRRGGSGFLHYLVREPGDRYYGFGEKSGNANKAGRRLRMRTADALGYDAETTDPLYKHIPFYLTVRPDLGGRTVGLFYDNLAHAAFDLGQEIDAYHGLYRSFEAADGDFDLYVIFGPALRDVVERYTALTGRIAFPPHWSLSYSGSAMGYTEAPDAAERLGEFLARLGEHTIPCRSFHLSSGYTKKAGRRNVFTWDRSRFPDPARLARRFADAGVRLIANVKPAMLTDHPRFAEVEAFRGFVRGSEDESRPHMAQFWGGEAAYLDFTNPQTTAWWVREVKAQLLDHGIASTWNDNNEFEIWDDAARVSLNGRGGAMACLRPVQTGLMLRASSLAQREHAPLKRPFLVSRSGGPGMQRYAQTWTGDNSSSWKTLRYNLRMGHGLSLSGIFNFGHDVGGFAGPRPEPELFLRWIEQGIYWPRFSIHSWNDDGSASEPWMYPEILGAVREALNWRERLIPLLYTLLWRAHAHYEPVLRPLFYDFADQAGSYEEHDAFMLGRDLLVAPVVERGAVSRSVWLPQTEGGWYCVRTGERYPGGHTEVPAPLGAAPVFARAGSILPLGPSLSWRRGPLTLRLFPLPGGKAQLELFDDDGESLADCASPPCLLHVAAEWDDARPPHPALSPGGEGEEAAALSPREEDISGVLSPQPHPFAGAAAKKASPPGRAGWERDGVRGSSPPIVKIARSGSHAPRWPEVQFEDAAGRPLQVTVDGTGEIALANQIRLS
ncbi:MAG: TIM-barrel domain-containing protein [Rhodomicrobium sp.]